MRILEALDEREALDDLVLGVVELAVNHPVLAVLALEIVHHEDHLVIGAQRERIAVVAQLLGEDRARGHQVRQGLRGLQAGLLEGGLVPVEDAAGHGHRDRQQLAVDGALRERARVKLGQVDDVRDLVQVIELGAAVRIGEGEQPVPVDLVDIEGGVRRKVLAHLVLPAGPGGVGAGHFHAGSLLEGVHSSLRRLVTGVAAPPGEGQGALGHRGDGGQRQRHSQQACDQLFH